MVKLRHHSNHLKSLSKTINSLNRWCQINNSLILRLKCDSLHCRWYSSHDVQIDAVSSNNIGKIQSKNDILEFHHEWPTGVKNEFQRHMIVIEDFVTENEELALCGEVQKAMRRMRYQYDHWDDAIHGYRELEKSDWSPDNEQVLQRMRTKAFEANVLSHVHCLDLAADGIIKPHVDSSRYCGNTIAGLSLLTDCIMRLKRVDETKYKQNRFGDEKEQGNEISIRSNPDETNKSEENAPNELNYFVDVLLKRRSLYIMKDSARYNFSHEVLPTKSTFSGKEIVKDRRLSIICRNQP